MATSIDVLRSREVILPPETKPLDMRVWNAWLAKNRVQDKHRSATRLKVMAWVAVAALLAGVGYWRYFV